MKTSTEIPVHRLADSVFHASYGSDINLGDHSATHRVDFFAIIWFGSDSDPHYIDFKPYPVKKNTVYLLARNQVHSIPQSRPDARVIIFSKDFFDSIEEDDLRFIFVPFNNEGITITPEMEKPMTYLFDLIKLENSTNNNLHLLHIYTSAFLLQLHRLSHNSKTLTAYHDERLRKLFQLIGTHYKTQKLVDFYADKIGLTSKRLNQIMKEKIGLSISQIIYNYTLIEAKREISHRTKSMKEIAIELGFKDQSYFSRFFKKQTGITPEHFRKEIF
ncbi:helix-turn-helix domain-containing protein [Mucilaginibacter agri]|uniref:Helix-turn-helix domain-containing protein n=1 Tax=Mucilaginibacter agri TaxID=2695265 RepID=A0A966DWT1_9SPHI|nr:helix-turn-helix domain-containing protein [Mucilaginibacter agri]NCD71664.1 helix-turn-helix domain-containing protein [Mucilaginibacter agri]